MHHFKKSVHHCEDDGVIFRGRKSSDKVQRDIRPGVMGHSKRVQETRGQMSRRLVLGTHRKGSHIFTNISLYVQPLEVLFYDEDVPFICQETREV